MRLAFKFALTFLLGLCAVLAIYAAHIARREVDLFQRDMRHDHHVLGESLSLAMRLLAGRHATASAMQLIDEANRIEDRGPIRVRWIDAPATRPATDEGTAHRAHEGQEAAALRNGREISWVDHEPAPGHLYTFVPIRSGRADGGLEISESLAEQVEYSRATRMSILLTTATVAGEIGLLGLAIGYRVVGRPVHDLINSTRAVASGDLTRRPRVHQHDELGDLAREIDFMCDQLATARDRLTAETAARIRTVEQLRHADRLKTVGQLASGIAHELGTPLNVVWARARRIGSSQSSASSVDDARIIAEQAERMTHIIRQLLDFARPRAPRRERVDLRELAARTAAMLDSAAMRNRVRISIGGDTAPVWVEADPDQLQQVLSNLMMNGIQAMPAGGDLAVTFEVRAARPPVDVGGPEAEYQCVRVRDSGHGISEEHVRRLFEPFFTTKQVGEGTGLGLSVSRGIIHEHGGWIGVASRPGCGAEFTLFLPREDVHADRDPDRR
jgi:signal transduction histidine kinase